ncbi:MAG: M18 family aminopeptidase [Magnetococcales bacterium]|nr:M18 family aminopeptidase [Magnetococcales bacterium]
MNHPLSERVIDFINASPTPYHAVDRMERSLHSEGFSTLREEDAWELQPGGRYCVIRDHGSLVAFVLPTERESAWQVRMVGAHTDSPCLKLKPNPVKQLRGTLVYDVEIYGGALLISWFDRDLSLAGLAGVEDDQGEVHHLLFDFKKPVTLIPHLAIHLNREVNKEFKLRKHEDLSPIADSNPKADPAAFTKQFERRILRHAAPQLSAGRSATRLLDSETLLYDTNPVTRIGIEGELITGARLDNLLSCAVGLEALLDTVRLTETNTTSAVLPMLALFNHEEVGSVSTTGADGNLAESILRRLMPDPEQLARSMACSRMLSADNAHACHPHHPGKQDENHCPPINQGLVIKTNANQRYATTARTTAHLRSLARKAKARLQSFVVRSDMPCGSTIGPMLSARLGIRTVDVGVPTWGMHSIRETAGVQDLTDLHALISAFLTDSSV